LVAEWLEAALQVEIAEYGLMRPLSVAYKDMGASQGK
jgi:hypothetical protein